MNSCNCLLYIAVLLFAPLAFGAALPQKPAPAEPDFLGANGAQITIGGKQYTIKVGAPDANGKRDVTVTSPANGQKTYKSNPNQTNRPVNHQKDGIQVFIGTDQRDVMVPAGQAQWNGLSVVMIGLGGDDILVGSTTGSGDLILGGAGNDLIIGREGTDQLWGGADSDAIAGGAHNDSIVGGSGNDNGTFNVLLEGDDVDFVDDDTVIIGDKSPQHRVTLTLGVDLPFGDNDRGLHGQAGMDDIWGLDGNDELVGGAPAATDGNYLDGGDDSDRIDGDKGADTVYGGGAQDIIKGGIGESDAGDFIFGGPGNDSITGAGGSDELFGEGGEDTVRGFSTGTVLDPNRDDGGNLIDGGDGEDVLLGSFGGDTMLGRNSRDKIQGAAGSNVICGGGHIDEILGGTGSDRINGEGEEDVIRGGIGNDYIWGGEGADEIYGEDGDDFIDGEQGADGLYGEGGNDRIVDVDVSNTGIEGGDGNDEINCFDGNNLLSFDGAVGGLGLDTFWADEFSADGTSIGDILPDIELAETWNVMPGPTQPADGTAKPVCP